MGPPVVRDGKSALGEVEVEDVWGLLPVAGGLELVQDAEAEGSDGGGVEWHVGGGAPGAASAAGGGGEADGVESAQAEEADAGGFVPGGGELFQQGAQAVEQCYFHPAGFFLAQAAEVQRPEDAAFGGDGVGGADEARGE